MKITEMPTKELLEEYLDGLERPVTVYFDKEKGKFIRENDNLPNRE